MVAKSVSHFYISLESWRLMEIKKEAAIDSGRESDYT